MSETGMKIIGFFSASLIVLSVFAVFSIRSFRDERSVTESITCEVVDKYVEETEMTLHYHSLPYYTSTDNQLVISFS